MTFADALSIFDLTEVPAPRDLKRRYRALMKRHHSDVGGSDAAAGEINHAFDILSGKCPADGASGKPTLEYERYFVEIHQCQVHRRFSKATFLLRDRMLHCVAHEKVEGTVDAAMHRMTADIPDNFVKSYAKGTRSCPYCGRTSLFHCFCGTLHCHERARNKDGTTCPSCGHHSSPSSWVDTSPADQKRSLSERSGAELAQIVTPRLGYRSKRAPMVIRARRG